MKAERGRIPDNLFIPEKPIDVAKVIKSLYEKIVLIFSKQPKVSFTELVGSDKKHDKIATFIPLLHLTNQEKIGLEQEGHFTEIYINLPKTNPA